MIHLWFYHHIIFKGLATNMTYHWQICHSPDWSNVCRILYCKVVFPITFHTVPFRKNSLCTDSTVWRDVFSSRNMPFPLIYLLIIYLCQYELMDIYFVFWVQPNAALFILYQFFPALSIGNSFTWLLWPIHICI